MVEGIEEKSNLVDLAELHLLIGGKACQLVERTTLEDLKNYPENFNETDRMIILRATQHCQKEWQRETGETISEVPWGNFMLEKGFLRMKQEIQVVKLLIEDMPRNNFESTLLPVDMELIKGFEQDIRGLDAIDVLRKKIVLEAGQGMPTRDARLGAMLGMSLYYQAVVNYCEEYLDKLVLLSK